MVKCLISKYLYGLRYQGLRFIKGENELGNFEGCVYQWLGGEQQLRDRASFTGTAPQILTVFAVCPERTQSGTARDRKEGELRVVLFSWHSWVPGELSPVDQQSFVKYDVQGLSSSWRLEAFLRSPWQTLSVFLLVPASVRASALTEHGINGTGQLFVQVNLGEHGRNLSAMRTHVPDRGHARKPCPVDLASWGQEWLNG